MGAAPGAKQDRKDRKMSTIRRIRTATLGIAAVCSVVLVGPVRAHETDHALTLVPVPAFDRQVVAAQQALQAGDLGSMQEEALSAMVAAVSTEIGAEVGNDALLFDALRG